jgi:glycosyltransferase involved in cell wall biosynthesis
MSELRKNQLILHFWSGNLYGGIERLLVTLAQFGRAEHHFALCFEGRLAVELRRHTQNLHFLPVPQLRSIKALAESRRAAGALIDRLNPEAAVTHSHWPAAVWGSSVRARARRWVFYAHDVHSRLDVVSWLGSRVSPDIVIANSEFTAQSYRRFTEVVVIHSPVVVATTTGGRQLLREHYGVSPEEVIILQASRMERWKGHLLLLHALSEIRLGRWRLWIAGGAQRAVERRYEASLRRRVRRLGIESQVHFLGERTDVVALMSAADIFCQPNERPEPFGLVFVEALNQGLPVLALAEGGVREIVTPECGVLTSRPGLTVALRNLIQDADLRGKLGACGPRRAMEICEPHRQTSLLESCILGEHDNLRVVRAS